MTLVSFLDKTDQQGQLMLAYAAGDASAFEKLYAHYRAPMFRFFTRQCQDRAIAEELYQELWMKVIRARESYEHSARFSTWLYRIAHNLVMDHFRRDHGQAAEEEPEELPGTADDEPEAQAISSESLARFQARLDALPDEQRVVFLLKEEGGLSLEEIAQTTGASFEAVKSRLRYAVRKLRESLVDAA